MAHILHFTKMEGLGNDYIFIDRDLYPTLDYPALAQRYCDRHTGIGGDGIVTYEKESHGLYRMRIYNRDGSEAEMCGNAIRCLAKLLYEERLVSDTTMEIRTGAGKREVTVTTKKKKRRRVTGATVKMGIPVVGESPLMIGEVTGTQVDMGNPHFVIRTEEPTEEFPLESIGPAMEQDDHFPEGVNVEVIRITARQSMEMRVWERGSGLTQACGTGASAAAALAIREGLVNSPVTVTMPGGDLTIDWSGKSNEPLYMTGSAKLVFEGELLMK